VKEEVCFWSLQLHFVTEIYISYWDFSIKLQKQQCNQFRAFYAPVHDSETDVSKLFLSPLLSHSLVSYIIWVCCNTWKKRHKFPSVIRTMFSEKHPQILKNSMHDVNHYRLCLVNDDSWTSPRFAIFPKGKVV